MISNKNVIIFIIESLNHYRTYLNLSTEYSLPEIKDIAKDGTTFHKCISVSNSSWMTTASILMGNDLCYQHNTNYTWGNAYSDTTVKNTYSDSLFHILKNNDYLTASFSSPAGKSTGHRLFLYDLIDDEGKRLNSLFGGGDNFFYNDKKNHFQGICKYIDENKNKNFSILSWTYLDHICLSNTKGPQSRISTYVETSKRIGEVVEKLKELNIYDKTDIYIIGDHGDTFGFYDEVSNQKEMHGSTPFHTTTHVPLIVKNSNIKKGNRYDLVSNIDLYSTILNSLNINFKNKKIIDPNLFSIDLKLENNREFVLSRNRFINQNKPTPLGKCLTAKEYNYVTEDDKSYLFYHILDPLNISNLLIKDIKKNSHYKSWFNDQFLLKIKNEIIPYFNNKINYLVSNRWM
jgi:membrane-anchored protein YejM (alkaline phosphatase superfamily)